MSTRPIVHFLCGLLVLPAILPIGGIPTSVFAQEATAPRLVLQITVDQLRGDLPTRYFDRLGDGGLRYLWENGTVYAESRPVSAVLAFDWLI